MLKKIKEGLLCISWDIHDADITRSLQNRGGRTFQNNTMLLPKRRVTAFDGFTQIPPHDTSGQFFELTDSSQVEVNLSKLTDVVESFILFCRMDEEQKITLEIGTSLAKEHST
jgi:hypothetical protein